MRGSKLLAALAATALVTAAAAAVPAQADPHPGQSVNVGIIDGPVSSNGGSLVTTGNPGDFGDFTFTNVPVANVTAANLAAFDTVVLNVASAGMLCDTGTLSAQQKADLVAFLNGGGKLIVYDSECQGPSGGLDYSWLPHPFTTSNPGGAGATGTLTILEDNFLASNDPASPHFIDANLMGSQSDAVGDMNVLTTQDPNICLNMTGTNAVPATGPTHVYYTSGSGLFIYNGFDIDDMGATADTTTASGNIAKVWLQELQQPISGQSLACAVNVIGITLAPQSATNPTGTTHTVTATHTDQSGNPEATVQITFKVTGANAGASGTCNPVGCLTDGNGQVQFTYTGANPGVDQIVACFTPNGGSEICSAPVTKTWVGAAAAGGTAASGSCQGRKATILGTSKSETIVGTNGPDVIQGLEGKDKIKALGGNDVVCGGWAADNLDGGTGKDLLIGGAGPDRLNGGPGKDRLFGGTPGAPAGKAPDTCSKGDTNSNCEKVG